VVFVPVGWSGWPQFQSQTQDRLPAFRVRTSTWTYGSATACVGPHAYRAQQQHFLLSPDYYYAVRLRLSRAGALSYHWSPFDPGGTSTGRYYCYAPATDLALDQELQASAPLDLPFSEGDPIEPPVPHGTSSHSGCRQGQGSMG
jgi:hypothetical protein